ncbi:MAG: ABC transporter substrate-binding protein [Patescibacteria group bacterium]
MFNLRFILRVLSTFVSRFKFVIVVGAFVGALFFILLKYISPMLFAGTTEKIGITGRYSATTLPKEVLFFVGNGLTKLDESGIPEPDLALSWETPDNGKTWIFKLDPNRIWHDGKKVMSQDIKYQFTDLSVETPDSETIVFKLQNSYSAFPVIVSKVVFKKGLLGTGEYKVKKVTVSGNIVQNISLDNEKGDIKVYKFYPTEERTKLAYKLGEVTKIENIINASSFSAWRGAKTEGSIQKGEYVAIFFNNSVSPLSEKNLRQALSYAINKDALGTPRAISPISKNSWAYNPQVKPYEYDMPKAKKVISELPKEITENLEITLTTSPVLLPAAEKIVKDWKDAGVNAEVRVQGAIPQDYQALLVIFDIPDDPDQYSLWHSTQMTSNISKYADPRIDKLLEDGRAIVNAEERKKIYLDFQRFLVEDAPAVFLYYPTTYTVERK